MSLVFSSGEFTSQLVWFEHPNTEDVFAETWAANVIPQGNDIADTFQQVHFFPTVEYNIYMHYIHYKLTIILIIHSKCADNRGQV